MFTNPAKNRIQNDMVDTEKWLLSEGKETIGGVKIQNIAIA